MYELVNITFLHTFSASAVPSSFFMASTTQQPFRLLDLPGELRNRIYAELLSSQCIKQNLSDGYARYDFGLALLLANRQIYFEARRIFRQNIFVRVTTPWPEAEEHVGTEGRVPMLARGVKADSFTAWHMTVILGSPHFVYASEKPSCSWIMCGEDLDIFCRLWFRSNLGNPGLNQHITLELTIQDPYQSDSHPSKNLQRSLMMPFGIVKGLDELVVGGYKRESVEKDLRAAMAMPDPSPSECIENAVKHKNAGNMELYASNYKLAISEYKEAFESLYIDRDILSERVAAQMSNFFNGRLESGTYKGQNAQDTRNALRVQLTANTVLAYLKLQDWTTAYEWGSRAINYLMTIQIDPFSNIVPAQADHAKLYYRTALALKGLGKLEEAHSMLSAASRFTPNDPVIAKEMGNWVH